MGLNLYPRPIRNPNSVTEAFSFSRKCLRLDSPILVVNRSKILKLKSFGNLL